MDTPSDRVELETERHGRLLVVTPIVKEITFKNTKNFLQSVKSLIQADQKDIVLDMRHIEIIDSMSLGTLVAILKYSRSIGGDMAIANVSPQIDDLFSLLNFQSVFRTFGSVREALEKF